jgi:MFS family permease
MAAAPPDTLSPLDELRLRRDWRLFIWLTFLFGFGFAIYNGVFANFFYDIAHGNYMDLAILESSREVPGLLAALLTGTLVALAESRIAGLGLGIGAIGIGVTGLVSDKPSIIVVSVFWSIGFHVYSTVASAITLALAKGKESGRHLGRMSAVGAVSTIAGLGLATAVARLFPQVHYSAYFIFAGVAIMVGALLCGMLSTHAEGGARQALILRKEYSLYYLLTFLDGCRRQVFGTFAIYVLISVYHVPREPMLTLQFVNAVLLALLAPVVGRLIDRVGERGPLKFYAASVILVFIGYAVFRSVGVLFALFIIDRVLFTFSVGFTTYLHRIVRPGELTPSLAMGTTMNHVAAVTVPIGGALIWQATGNYQWPFVVGALISALSFGSMLRLPTGPRPTDRNLEPAESVA